MATVAGVAWWGAPVQAQLPDLLPTSTTTTAPASPSTTLLPPLESLTPPPTTAPPGSPSPTLLPAPPGDAPPPTLLPAPPRTSRTTTFTTTPVPPRTPVRTSVTTSAASRAPTSTAAAVADDLETGGAEGGFEAALPFTPGDEQIAAAGLDAELGGRGSEQQVGALASVAAGLIAVVLLGVVGWVQAQVRRRADAEVASGPRW